MKAWSVIAAELYKQKKGILWKLAFGSPALVSVLVFLNMSLRYDYLMQRYAGKTSWEAMLNEVFFLWAFFLPIGVTLLAAIVHFREYSENAWKHLLSLPVRRGHVYAAKWLVIVLATVLSVLALMAGLRLSGLIIGFPEPFPFGLYGQYALYLIFSSLGIASVQHWLSSRFRNTIIPVAVGVSGTVGAIFLAQSEWMRYIPYAAPLFAMPGPDGDAGVSIVSGLLFGTAALLAGMLEFGKRDIL